MKKFRLYWLAAFLLLALLYLQYHLWISANGMRDVHALKQKVAKLQAENESLKQKNMKLWFQVDRLKNTHDATEEKARNELGMIKKNETFYQFVR
jgi:cell division protein FtsB